MVVQLGEAEVLVGEVAQAGEGVLNGNLSLVQGG
jgi:hypothetical protein